MIAVCIKYNASFINIASLALSVSFVMLLGVGIDKLQKTPKNEIVPMTQIVETERKIDMAANNIVGENTKVEKTFVFDWYIEIPKINLYAPIEEGTGEEVLNRSIGHFPDTARRNGNCGFAAHNRGYRVNYFARIKELEKNDKIYYFVDGKKYTYRVEEVFIVYETDWSVLDETKENRLTLLTCVENREEYRLCVQAVLEE